MTTNIAGFDCVLGCDVSRWQGGINYNVFNLDFVIYKATGGDGGLYVDGKFKDNANGYNTVEGPYHFSSPAAYDPIQEADHFANTILNSSWATMAPDKRLPPTLDWEPTIRVNNSASWIRRFTDHLADRVQQQPIIYSAGWCAPNGSNDDMAALQKHPFWLAAYVPANTVNNYPCPPWGNNWDCWQYSSTGSVSGIAGNCDTDAFKADRFAALLHGSPLLPAPAPVNHQEDDEMKTIIAIETKLGHYVYDPQAGTGRVITPEEEVFLVGEGWTVKSYPAGGREHVILNEKVTKLNYTEVS